MKSVTIYAGAVFLSLTFTARCETPAQVEFLNATRLAFKTNADRYLTATRPPADPSLTPSKVMECAIKELITKLKQDIAAKDLSGSDNGARAYNRMVAMKRKNAEEKLYVIAAAQNSGDQKMLRSQAIQSLNEDLQLATMKFVSHAAMLIEDSWDEKETMNSDKNLNDRTRDYWAAWTRLDVLLKSAAASIPLESGAAPRAEPHASGDGEKPSS